MCPMCLCGLYFLGDQHIVHIENDDSKFLVHRPEDTPAGFNHTHILILEQNDKNKHFQVNKLEILSIFAGC